MAIDFIFEQGAAVSQPNLNRRLGPARPGRGMISDVRSRPLTILAAVVVVATLAVVAWTWDRPSQAPAAAAPPPTLVQPRPTPDPNVRRVITSAQWLSEPAITWMLTGAGGYDPNSDIGMLAPNSQVRLVAGAAQGSHVSQSASALGKTYAAATLIAAGAASSRPPNEGVRFWISEADLAAIAP